MDSTMQAMTAFFGSINSGQRIAIWASGVLLFWLLESVLPLFPTRYHRVRHAALNFTLTGISFAVNIALAFVIAYAIAWTQEHQFGILYWLPAMPIWLYVVVGVVLFDLTSAYIPHRMQHEIKFLWRFHALHHSDPHVDSNTAVRHHPLDTAMRALFTAGAVVLTGTPLWFFYFYQTLALINAQIVHSNVQFPRWLDDALSWVYLSPDMHRTHHHYRVPYTDSNYSNFLSIWDRLLGTYTWLDRKELVFGLDTHPELARHSHIPTMLKDPFVARAASTAVGEG